MASLFIVVLNVTNGSNKSPSYVRWNKKQSSFSEQKSFDVSTIIYCYTVRILWSSVPRVVNLSGRSRIEVSRSEITKFNKNYFGPFPVMTSLSSLPVKCENDVATPTGDVVNRGYKTIVFVWKNYYTSLADEILDMTSIFRNSALKKTFISFEAFGFWIVHEYLTQ